MHAVSFSKTESKTPVLYCNLRPPHSAKPFNKFLATHISWIKCDNYLLQRRLIRFFSLHFLFFLQEVINLHKRARTHKIIHKHR
jgi:hypothetical protein